MKIKKDRKDDEIRQEEDKDKKVKMGGGCSG
jgi:hypothetical protein